MRDGGNRQFPVATVPLPASLYALILEDMPSGAWNEVVPVIGHDCRRRVKVQLGGCLNMTVWRLRRD